MATAVALAAYGLLLAGAATAVWRRPLLALYVFIVGLALHNAVMAGLYGLGLRGDALTLVQAWKEVLLAVALARVATDAWRARRLPFEPGLVDVFAVAFAAVLVAYAVVPQDVLGGEAGGKTVLYALRHDATVVAAYFLGRSLVVDAVVFRRIAWTVLATAAAVALVGLVEVYTVPVETWRDAEVPGYFNDQLGFDHHGPATLPENFVFNTGDENDLLRRLVSTFLSPLGAAYMLVVALLFAPAVRTRRRVTLSLAAAAFAGLLFTHTRAALLVLVGGLVVLALTRRAPWAALAATGVVAIGLAFTALYPRIAPETHWFPADLAWQRQQAKLHGGIPENPLAEPSLRSHLTSLRDGLERVAEHPQGYGLGNAGSTASRTDVPLKAGESTYTELGVGGGLAALFLFLAWNSTLLWSLLRDARGRVEDAWAPAVVGAALAAVLALALQTDVLGVPWLAFCVWMLGGALLVPRRARAPAVAPAPAAVGARLERA